MSDPAPVREMALPGGSLRALRRTLRAEVGSLPAIHALQAAGSRVGGDVLPALLRGAGTETITEMERDRFWELLDRYFQRRGWGRISHRAIHPTVGLLEASNWAEADSERGESQPTCAFTTGLLSGLLSRVAEGPVAVLEVACRSSGDDACRFAFGSGSVIHRLYGDLLEGSELDDALSRL